MREKKIDHSYDRVYDYYLFHLYCRYMRVSNEKFHPCCNGKYHISKYFNNSQILYLSFPILDLNHFKYQLQH